MTLINFCFLPGCSLCIHSPLPTANTPLLSSPLPIVLLCPPELQLIYRWPPFAHWADRWATPHNCLQVFPNFCTFPNFSFLSISEKGLVSYLLTLNLSFCTFFFLFWWMFTEYLLYVSCCPGSQVLQYPMSGREVVRKEVESEVTSLAWDSECENVL